MASPSSELVAANSQFAFEMFHKLADANPQGNVFFSPVSISIALAMTYLGARGNTAAEMEKVARFEGVEKLHENFVLLDAVLNKKKNYTLSTANQLFGRENYNFLETFLSEVQELYQAKLELLDFGSKPDESRKIINDWVAEKTADKIKDLIPSGAIDPMTALVLVNAIYFKGSWDNKFDPNHTRKADFYVGENKVKKVDMMNKKAKYRLAYDYDADSLILELPYVGKELSMIIMLPKERNGLSKLEASLSYSFFHTVLSSLKSSREEDVVVKLPRFKFEHEVALDSVLQSMGMVDLFSSTKADLSGMDGTRMLYISRAFHKAFVDVNEEGTEAAAATAMVAQLRSMPRVTMFQADHPFIFLIQENSTGSILFIGKMVDPGGEVTEKAEL